METPQSVFEDVFGLPDEDIPREEYNRLMSAFKFGWESALKFEKCLNNSKNIELLLSSNDLKQKTRGISIKK